MAQFSFQPKTKKRGFLETAIRSAIKPFTNVAADVGTSANALLDPNLRRIMLNPEEAGKTMSGNQLRGAEQSFYKPSQFSGFTQKGYTNRLGRIQDAPLLEAGKTAAGVMSYAVPAGGTLKSAVQLGALGGGLYGIGTSEKQDIPGLLTDTSQNAIGGGVGGGLAFGASKLIEKGLPKLQKTFSGSKLQETGKDLQKNSLKRVVGSKPVGSEGGVELLTKVTDLAKERGAVINTADDAVKLADDVFKDWGSVVRDELATATEKGVDTGKFTNAVVDKMDDLLKKSSSADEKTILKVFDEVVDNVQKFGDTPLGWYRTKQILGDKGKWNISFTPDKAPQKEAYEELYKVINNQMEDILPDGLFREANEKVATALNLKKWASRSEKATLPSGIRFSDPTMDIGLTGSLISAATGNPFGAVSGVAGAAGKDFIESPSGGRVIGKGLEKMGEKIGERGVTFFPGLQGAGANAGMDLTMQLGGRLAGASASSNQSKGSRQFQKQTADSMTKKSGTQSVPGLAQQQQMPQPSVEDIYMKKMQLAYIASQYPEIASQVKIAQEMLDAQLSTDSTDLTATERESQRDAVVASDTLSDLEQTFSRLGGGLGIAGFLGKNVPIASTEAKRLDAKLSLAAQTLGTFLEGGKLTDADIERYKKDVLPTVSDPPATVTAKLQNLKRLFESRSQQY